MLSTVKAVQPLQGIKCNLHFPALMSRNAVQCSHGINFTGRGRLQQCLNTMTTGLETSGAASSETSLSDSSMANGSNLSTEDKELLNACDRNYGRAKTLLLVAMMSLHEESQPVEMEGPDGQTVRTQGLIDSAVFVACLMKATLTIAERTWGMKLSPTIKFGYMNLLESKASVPHLWVYTKHDELANLRRKCGGTEEQVRNERYRISDIAGGVLHAREKRLLGMPFEAQAEGETQEVTHVSYSNRPQFEVPDAVKGTEEVLRSVGKSPLRAMSGAPNAAFMMRSFKKLVNKLYVQAQKGDDDLGKCTVNPTHIAQPVSKE